MSELLQKDHEVEQTYERKAIVIGRLKDLGLGNPDGIPSEYADASDEELQEIADRDNERLVEPTNTTAFGCIDGRHCKCNADGSKAEIRLRRVGGSASNLGVAMNARASVVETIDMDAPILEIARAIDDAVGERSAHLGSCGGANGEVTDNHAIHKKPAVADAGRALLAIPDVSNYFEFGEIRDKVGEEKFVEMLESAFTEVTEQAGKTAEFEQIKGWNGQEYVDDVAKDSPQNVEDLEVDHDDHKFHGHRESKLTIIIGDKTSEQDDEFVWNLKSTKQVAEALAGQGGHEGYLRVVVADTLKHMAVADRLPSDETPVILQVA